MQQSMNKFSSACDSFGLTISTKKTEVMFQPAPRNAYTEPSITVKGVTLKVVESFAYLGSILSRSVRIDNEVDARIAKASTAFGRLRKKVWESNGLTTRTKLKVYKAVVLPSLLYSCETWTVYSSHANTLNRFHLDCLRKIPRVKWQDKIPDTEVLRLADLPSIHTILGKNQLRWSGHVSRMDDYRLPKHLFYGELLAGKCSVGGQYKRYKDTLKVTMKNFHIDPDNWEQAAQDRPTWRSLIHKGGTVFENNRIENAEKKRELRKQRQNSDIPLEDSNFASPTCGRQFRARIGLFSHIRTHRRWTIWCYGHHPFGWTSYI